MTSSTVDRLECDEPGGERADDDGDHILVLQALQHAMKAGALRSGSVAPRQQLQRQQHQAEADGDAAEMARLVLFARQEGDDAGARSAAATAS